MDTPALGPGSSLGLGLTPADFSNVASFLTIMAYLVLESTDCGQVPRFPTTMANYALRFLVGCIALRRDSVCRLCFRGLEWSPHLLLASSGGFSIFSQL